MTYRLLEQVVTHCVLIFPDFSIKVTHVEITSEAVEVEVRQFYHFKEIIVTTGANVP